MRIETRSESNCLWYLPPVFWRQQQKYGKTLDVGLLWARCFKLPISVVSWTDDPIQTGNGGYARSPAAAEAIVEPGKSTEAL